MSNIVLTWWNHTHLPQMAALSELTPRSVMRTPQGKAIDVTIVALDKEASSEAEPRVIAFIQYQKKKESFLVVRLCRAATSDGEEAAELLLAKLKARAMYGPRRMIHFYVSEYDTNVHLWLKMNGFRAEKVIKEEIFFIWRAPEVVNTEEVTENEDYVYGELDFLD